MWFSTEPLVLQYRAQMSTGIIMPEELLTLLGHALFTLQSIIAFAVFLFASQRDAFPWAGWLTSV